MLKPIKAREYQKVVGRRYYYEAATDLLFQEKRVLVPKGDVLEVSVLEAAPDHGQPETAVIYHSRTIAVLRGISDPEVAVSKLLS